VGGGGADETVSSGGRREKENLKQKKTQYGPSQQLRLKSKSVIKEKLLNSLAAGQKPGKGLSWRAKGGKEKSKPAAGAAESKHIGEGL